MIATPRLLLLPLTYSQLLKYIRCDHSLETELHVQPSSRKISIELKAALEETILPKVADPSKNYLYSTLWTAVMKESNQMVGDICIVGEPNEAGEIEIGYGTYDEFKNKGYMTEIVGGMLEWVKTQPTVKTVIASTEKENISSCKVLEKNGFTNYGENGNLILWKRMVKEFGSV